MLSKIRLFFITLTIILFYLLVSDIFPRYIDFFEGKLGQLPNNEKVDLTRSAPSIKLAVPVKQKENQLQPVNSPSKPVINQCAMPTTLSDITIDAEAYEENMLIRYPTINKYYTLYINQGFQDKAFQKVLNQKLFKTFNTIEKRFDIFLGQQTMLNMVFKTNRQDYENYMLELGHSPSGNQGAYLYPKHIAIIEIKNNSQGLETAIHEAIHAFNQSYWGNTLRFFNEGMARYFQKITTQGVVMPFDFRPLQHQQFPMQIDTLLFSDTDWHSDNNQSLYTNSHAFFYFLMTEKKGRELIWEIMRLEQKDRCTVLPKSTVEAMLFEIYPNHQQEFDYWFADGLERFYRSTEQ